MTMAMEAKKMSVAKTRSLTMRRITVKMKTTKMKIQMRLRSSPVEYCTSTSGCYYRVIRALVSVTSWLWR